MYNRTLEADRVYEVVEFIEVLYNKPNQIDSFINNTMRQFMIEFKKRNQYGAKCTDKQIKYLNKLLAYQLDYNLNDSQICYIKSLTVSQVSELIEYYLKHKAVLVLKKP